MRFENGLLRLLLLDFGRGGWCLRTVSVLPGGRWKLCRRCDSSHGRAATYRATARVQAAVGQQIDLRRMVVGGQCGDLFRVATDLDQLVALFVDEKLALDTLEALAAQAPDPVVAVGTGSPPIESFGLKKVAVDPVELPPSACTTSVNALILSQARQSRGHWHTWEN